jgi:protein-tyrosine phosphatase
MTVQPKPIAIMFVCLGNICRSPAAQSVMQSLVQSRGLAERFSIDSAGTASYHIGRKPDSRMILAGTKRNLKLESLAKAIEKDHAAQRDLIVAMDRDNLRNILSISKLEASPHIRLLSDYLDGSWPRDVPDPYYGGEAGFEYVLDMLFAACPKILDELAEKFGLITTVP